MAQQNTRPRFAELLELQPHPEGGWFRETWRSPVTVEPSGYQGTRASATAIYFALGPGEESRWHQVRSAELWMWHGGGDLRLLLGGSGSEPSTEVAELVVGPVETGGQPQALVPAGVWQAARPAADAEVLVSCVVSPGFDFADFRML
ncbi:MAG: cupin domain-containing protein [Streptosporangiales bacterium]|nr:cupin domain-containing protein [Streptosporangiales bacterium]